MARQFQSTEIEDIKTDTYDKVSAKLTFEVEGRRNVPSLQSLGEAADAATWLFNKMLEASYLELEAKKAAIEAIKKETVSKYLTAKQPVPTPQPQPVATPVATGNDNLFG